MTWSELVDREDVLIVDTETTGLGAGAEIVEIAILDTTGRERLNEVVLPRGSVPGAAANVHGLTKRVLRKMGAKPWPEIDARVRALLQAATVVLFYNAEFDAAMLRQTAALYDLADFGVGAKTACLMLLYSDLRQVPHEWREGEFKWHTLEKALRYEGGRPSQEHRALSDCRMSLELLRRIAAKRGAEALPTGADGADDGPGSAFALGCVGVGVLALVIGFQFC